MQNVLLLDSDMLGLPVVRCLGNDPRTRIHVLGDRDRPPVCHSRFTSSYTQLAMDSDDDVRLDFVLELVKRHKIDVVLPCRDHEMLFLFRCQNALAPHVAIHPVPHADTWEAAIDKWSFSQLLRREDLAAPRTAMLESEGAFNTEVRDFRFPVIVKPTNEGFGRNIHRAPELAALEQFVAERTDKQRSYIVQEWINGYDIDFSCLCSHGEVLAYTIQREVTANRKAFRPPSVIAFVHEPEVAALGSRLMASLKWNGVAHIDMRYDEEAGDYKIIELNGRYWGSVLASLAAGINFPALGCAVARGESFAPPHYEEVTYSTGREALKRAFQTMSPSVMHHSALRFFLQDPVPEVVGRLRRV